ncbi:hypothetical protein LOZ61_004952 [Ophidiomyces ophidiicola]|uniref:Uncharacterized protein n=1 Tax=Ophidiomyces ophidiicola TaxID=1387563 RepID=A0ACB8USA6_9EURO|nr:hypothetical protein LOZ61_004952 [Ophidiomyces ophidiicola]KAI1923581.1 hypothetical protein LOZ60_005115 [Ophidiomyces ophidiicola]KAI1954578.1 hypothetical protein LOZ59_004866 [Ophidiomyces ophidiicola]KAI1969861.1 hypothetical protein LOZ56_004109 [Ophidiomyces ophidiicola]KAI2036345.1 hypothetical protein LOZ48_001017 [Ophidiomyces ophidiicola]
MITATAASAKSAMFPLSNLSSAFHSLSLTSKRNFSSTLPAQTTRQLPSYIPPYPYGPRRTFKQADSGLYGGSTIQFGNKISKGRNKGKTRRIWKPNVDKEKLYSEALGQWLEIKVQHRVLRTIRKVGGLDQYLLGDKPARIKELGIFGWGLRWKVMTSKAMKKRYEEERKELGLEKPVTFKQFLSRYTMEQQVKAAVHDQAQQPTEQLELEVEESLPESSSTPKLNVA